jgi:hypothetical protein
MKLAEAYAQYRQTDKYWSYPLEVRIRFQRIADWLSPREASWPLENVTASFAKRLRDRASRERGG